MKLDFEIELLSSMHLGSGKGDVVIDAEVVHDEYGLPYFPAKRLRGLLSESAVEVVEMGECSGISLITMADVERVFGKSQSKVELFVHDLYLPDYEDIRQQWQYLQTKYKHLLSPWDVLDAYTSIRYQTEIDRKTGTAAEGSLHNMRVVDAGLKFRGSMELVNGNDDDVKVLVLAAANLRYAGAKRNRGFGEIACRFLKHRVEDMLGGDK